MLYKIYTRFKSLLEHLLKHAKWKLLRLRAASDNIANPSIRNGVWRFTVQMDRFIRLLEQLPRQDVTHISSQDINILWVGDFDTDAKATLNIFFAEGYNAEKLGRVALWKLPQQHKIWLQTYDLVFSAMSWSYPFSLPAAYSADLLLSVAFFLDIEGVTVEDFLVGKEKSTIRARINRSSRENYEWEDVTSVEDLRYFYDRMYLPLITKRHGDNAYIQSFEELEKTMSNGRLSIAYLDGQRVVGALSYVVNGVLYIDEFGLLDGDEALIKRHALTACYWYLIRYAIETPEINKIGFGWASAYHMDGVFTYKQRWGARIEADWLSDMCLMLRAEKPSTALVERINEMGFVAYRKPHYLRVYLNLPQDACQDAKMLAKRNGTDGILVITQDNQQVYV